MEFTYTPHGVCSRQILLELDGNKVSNVRFIGGCSGNTQGIARRRRSAVVVDDVDHCHSLLSALLPSDGRNARIVSMNFSACRTVVRWPPET